METNQLLNLSPSQLRKAADLKERIDSLSDELSSILGEITGGSTLNGGSVEKVGRRKMSAAGRARIAAAARARWAKVRAAGGSSLASTTRASSNGAGKKRRT